MVFDDFSVAVGGGFGPGGGDDLVQPVFQPLLQGLAGASHDSILMTLALEVTQKPPGVPKTGNGAVGAAPLSVFISPLVKADVVHPPDVVVRNVALHTGSCHEYHPLISKMRAKRDPLRLILPQRVPFRVEKLPYFQEKSRIQSAVGAATASATRSPSTAAETMPPA